MTTLFAGAVGVNHTKFERAVSNFMSFDNQKIAAQYRPTECLSSDRSIFFAKSIKQTEAIVNDHTSGIQLVGWLRIDNSDELHQRLGSSVSQTYSDSQLIIKAYEKWGDQLGENLVGDFACALYDPAQKRCLLIRDQLGVRALYYSIVDDTLIFTNSLALFRCIHTSKPVLNKEWLCSHLFMNSTASHLTVYEQTFSVEAAHTISFTNTGLKSKRYFCFDPNVDQSTASMSSLIEEYQFQLQRAVSCRLANNINLGVELSGGLDSSSIAVLADKAPQKHGNQLSGFGFIGFEREAMYAMETAHMANLKAIHLLPINSSQGEKYETGRKQIDSLLASPLSYIDAETFIPLYQQAQSNHVEVLLSGFGGNEGVTSTASTGLYELFLNGRILDWYKRLSGPTHVKTRVVMNWSRRWLSGNLAPPSALNLSELQDYCVVKDQYQNEYLNSKIEECLVADPANFNHHVCRRLSHPQISHRLENCSLAAASFGLEYRWPLLDLRLLNFFLSVPVQHKLGLGGTTRYLHRRAMDCHLPKSVCWHKASEGMGKRYQSRISPPTIDLLDYEQLEPELQDIIDPDKLKNTQQRYLDAPKRNRALPYLRKLNRLNSWCTSH